MGDPTATTLFASWLQSLENGEKPDLDALCAAHPECADTLRALHAEWGRLEIILDEETPTTRLDLSNQQDDPGLLLIPPPAGESETAPAPLLERLGKRGAPRERFVVKERIGKGGMGAVFRVYDSEIGRHVAAKVLYLDDPRYLPRFLEEAQITGQLDHPAFIPVHDFALDEKGRIFFTMKLVKGITDEKTDEVRAETLGDVIEKIHAGTDDWTLTRGLDVILRVAEAMEFAHVKGVVHRDLKPANILVGRYGEVYVTDFGIARVAGKERSSLPTSSIPLTMVRTERRDTIERGIAKPPTTESPISPGPTEEGSTIGTAEYMPPEQAEGRLSEIGTRSDIYSLGATLYHLIASVPPWHTHNDHPHRNVIVKRIVSEARPAALYALAPRVAAELIAIVEKAMSAKPSDRYESMNDFATDLRAYLERRVVKAYRTGVVAETRLWVARNRALAAAIVVGFVALGAFGWSQRIAAARAVEIAEKQRAANESERARVAALERVLQLSDVKELRDLQARGKALLDDRGGVYRSYSGYDALIASRKQWIVDAESMATRLPTHEATLDSIESRGRRSADGASLAFDSKEDAWWHSAVSELVTGFRSLSLDDPNATSIRSMRDRIADFEKIYAHSVGEHRAEWDACIASIADPAQCPQYNGLKIVPQIGLLPIGRDAQSGLWEFWFVDITGVKPERGADGKLLLTDDFGLVFVLLPGGKFWMGAQKDDPNGQNYDPFTRSTEGPVNEVSVAPYFLSKYEMTEQQWIVSSPDDAWLSEERPGRRPATLVSWDKANRILPTLTLALPTEEQWEYGCRAGTTTPWSSGTEESSLADFGYVATPSKDGKWFTTPISVGSLLPNPFGLHDMHGNAREWTIGRHDLPRDQTNSTSSSSGETSIHRPRSSFVARGGSRGEFAVHARSAMRFRFDPGDRSGGNGVRPCRDVMSD